MLSGLVAKVNGFVDFEMISKFWNDFKRFVWNSFVGRIVS